MAGRNAGSVTKAVDRICRVAVNRSPLFALPACSTPNWLYGTKKGVPNGTPSTQYASTTLRL